MSLFIHLSSISENVASAFRKDGWKLTCKGGRQVLADHPEVCDEASARERLNHMGFLVSRSLKIDFDESPIGSPVRELPRVEPA
jgi:hypothetical protein